jgi:uncharacterized protein YydD (DUF2326 family)
VIHKVYSDLDTFKTLEFHAGLNVLLSEKSAGATDTQTRNRAGKTSFVELVNFLTGSRCDASVMFSHEPLSDYRFGMVFDLGNGESDISRQGKHHNRILINQKNLSIFPINPKLSKKDGLLYLSNEDWKRVCGNLFFGLGFSSEETAVRSFAPTFRMLFPYFARRQNKGGFGSPTRHHSESRLCEEQVSVSFLLGLDWTISSRFEEIRKKERDLERVRQLSRKGELGDILVGSATLRSKMTILEEKIEKAKLHLREFNVLPKYRELEKEAADLTGEIGRLSNENVVDRELISRAGETMELEFPPNTDKLMSLYSEAGIVLPELVTSRFEDVQAFHESIIKNRRAYLSDQVERADKRIEKRDKEKRSSAGRLAEIMKLLESHGAFDQYEEMRGNLTVLESDFELTSRQFEQSRAIENQQDELLDERRSLKRLLDQDIEERRASTLDKAILYFEEVSSFLYSEPGVFTCKPTDNGPIFEVNIQGGESKGITNMRIFCFDMMLARVSQERGLGPGFLIHDSHLFDGVDQRQVAKAIEYGAAISQEHGFQYLITLNEDAVPTEYFSHDFNFDQYRLPVVLTDATRNGGLFGMRFD